jgi:hypothetical protein
MPWRPSQFRAGSGGFEMWEKEDRTMKAFLSAVVVSLVIAAGAYYVMDSTYQQSAYSAFTTDGVRLGEPTRNLMTY